MINIETQIKNAIEAADGITEPISRKTKLLRIADELPKTEEFTKLRLHAMRLALDLADTAQHKKASLEEIAHELPKSSDISFYRSYTLLGIAGKLPKTSGGFINLYKEAIQRALDAAAVIKEPYYREYTLLYITKELPKTEEYLALYKQAIEEAFRAAKAIHDPFAKEHALIEILQEIPKTPEFSGLLHEVIKQALDFYAAKTRLKNIDILGRIDYLIAGEQRRLTESKKTRYTKTKYGLILAKELEQIGLQSNDIRLIETVRPFTHVWIQPAALRAAAVKIASHLENIRSIYHGREIERPVFVSEHHPVSRGSYISYGKEIPYDFLSLDLGATNTVIMRRKGGAQPEFLTLGSASILYGDTYLIPTVCIPETNSIGAEAIKKSPLMDIKKMLLEDHPEGKRYMETYIRILFKRLKEALSQGKGFSFFSKKLIDAIYVTAPVGFQNYRKALQKILEKTIRGARIEFVEEPLAAAIGYQVAEERDKVVLIVDFGGCTLNTMLARLNINEAHVIAKPDTAQTLGGHDIDLWLAEYLAKKIGMSKDDKLRGVLASTAEEIKISLSEHRLTSFAWNGTEICKVSREDLEDLLAKHDFYKTIDRTISYILKKAEKVGVKKDMIEAVLLTGGSSQIPSFKEKIEHLFPELAKGNAVYEHSPLSAAAHGAALYPTKNLIVDRHTSLACAIRYATRDKDAPYSYKIILENNESLPLEKTFRIAPARTLGAQNEIYLELFEVPENLVARRWVMESGMEFIRQEMKQPRDMALKACKIITLPFQEPLGEDIDITFCVKDTGHLAVRCGKENREIETGIRLQ